VVGLELSDAFYHFELPRLLLSIAVGAVLALTGVMTQSLFHNPLAEPGVLGISSGASLVTLLGLMVLPLSWHQPLWVAGLTLLGALLVSAALLWVWQRYTLPTVNLLLIGVLVNALCGGFIQILTLLMDGEMVRGWLFWSAGQLGNASWGQVGWLMLLAVSGGWILWKKSTALDALLLGDAIAYSLGVEPRRFQRGLLAGAAVLVASTLAVCGQVGFVGLMAPHLARAWCGGNHKRLIPNAMIIGAVLVALADWGCQHLIEGGELPVGSLTTLMGVPVLLHALIRHHRSRY